MELEFRDCPHCNTKGVLPMTDGKCPNCKRSLGITKRVNQHDDNDSGPPIPSKQISLEDPEQRSWLRENFIAHLGEHEFNIFVKTVMEDERLRFWNESELKNFAKKHHISFPIDMKNFYLVFWDDIKRMGVDIKRTSTVFIDSDKKFYANLFPEEGPATCKNEGCQRKTVQQSEFCATHHFEMIKNKPCLWDGPPNLTDEERRFLEGENREKEKEEEPLMLEESDLDEGDLEDAKLVAQRLKALMDRLQKEGLLKQGDNTKMFHLATSLLHEETGKALQHGFPLPSEDEIDSRVVLRIKEEMGRPASS